MARRVRKSVADQAMGSAPAAKPSVDLKRGAVYNLPTNQRSMIFLFFEFGLFFAAALAMWPVDHIIGAVLFAVAVGLPLVMYYYDGTKTPRSAVISEDSVVLNYRFGKPKRVEWDDIEFLQKIDVYERFSSRSKPLGWMKARSMKAPVVLSNKAGDAAIYAYTLKKGTAPPAKVIPKEEID
ncbi:MAG TPA: hypothetical protein VLU38_03605 [Methanomassiliicoccales archaeon]|nr:hypothetical protein [Methanomassiliicoccales archaeon]